MNLFKIAESKYIKYWHCQIGRSPLLTVPVESNIINVTGPISGSNWVLMAWR